MVDDLDWSNGLFSFCDARRLYPLIITDNGKSGLRARIGIIKMDHPFHYFRDVVGRSAAKRNKRSEENVFI